MSVVEIVVGEVLTAFTVIAVAGLRFTRWVEERRDVTSPTTLKRFALERRRKGLDTASTNLCLSFDERIRASAALKETDDAILALADEGDA